MAARKGSAGWPGAGGAQASPQSASGGSELSAGPYTTIRPGLCLPGVGSAGAEDSDGGRIPASAAPSAGPGKASTSTVIRPGLSTPGVGSAGAKDSDGCSVLLSAAASASLPLAATTIGASAVPVPASVGSGRRARLWSRRPRLLRRSGACGRPTGDR